MNQAFLRPEIVADLVADCLGVVKVLCIVGPCGSGKTVALKQWSETTRDADGLRVAYVDNHTLLIRTKADVAFDGKVKGALPGHYPMFDLKGAEVVIVDEPIQNRDLVARLFAHIDPAKGPFTHRLLLLPVQQKRVLELLEIPRSAIRFYSVEGVRL
ncbi:hypothetical protein [Burkholderia cepacia]|uniref:Uncharacterized protein n=1 Tax=Burkholderia cepacia TaxID=292 RepID=A0AAX2RHN5_BURCE|nr:hypothetical protein [Burkholderia cepacia]TES99601.1 hypothetical protein E3D36_24230 [Burkholderia cepacia]TEU41594.1 hypothetical protein E3D37_26615 [Burkholderia cepacia]TEU48779.1 hypothetical protein E3D38_21520 [Burkholderia cepacia]TEU95335.1 hypothetical protein E3D40_24705 [Burkholderia cepacia]TEV04729.1 hypothetical protein E3D44_26230 [Burkholderia cepacia]